MCGAKRQSRGSPCHSASRRAPWTRQETSRPPRDKGPPKACPSTPTRGRSGAHACGELANGAQSPHATIPKEATKETELRQPSSAQTGRGRGSTAGARAAHQAKSPRGPAPQQPRR
eukprot:Amastigsp_a852412_7.p2 type:complete len:116 gc:universal Amastigsp_a852412_7:534-881(+)